jgi:putative glutamine amidotransferase
LLAAYTDAVLAAGGLPQILAVPDRYDRPLLDDYVAACNGLLFTGGYDLHPDHYNQAVHAQATLLNARRDRFEVDLFRRADAADTPILAICLGHQIAHVTRGGRLIQHVDDLGLEPAVTHYLPNEQNAFHDVTVETGSRLAGIVGVARFEVNSRHHQIVDSDNPGAALRPVARSPDGVLEASEDPDRRFLLTVQWHPEDLIDRPEHLRLFAALVQAAGDERPN